MFVTKMALPRRTFLRGVGATVALPFLDAMLPALSAAPAGPKRLGFIYGCVNGAIQEAFFPQAVGPLVELPPTLNPLARVREKVVVLSGLAHRQADSFGDGNGDHPRATAVWLSGMHAWERPIGGSLQSAESVKLGKTADQYAADVFGKETIIPSLEYLLEKPTQGACDSKDCFFANTISWRTETTPNPMETHPRVIFERLFGEGGSAAQRVAMTRQTASILDSVLQEVAGLSKRLGAGDRSKLDQYLESVREIERRIQRAEATNSSSPFELPDRPTDIPGTFAEHLRLMFDLQHLAFQADLTRVFSMMFAMELSGRTYPEIGVPEGNHALSHHRNDPLFITKKQKIDAYHSQLLASFLEKLENTREGDGTLLDRVAIVYGGGIGDGNLHEHTNIPTLVAGGLGGTIKTGQHLKYPDNTPMANLLIALLDKAGVSVEKIGDSTGRLDLREAELLGL